MMLSDIICGEFPYIYRKSDLMFVINKKKRT